MIQDEIIQGLNGLIAEAREKRMFIVSRVDPALWFTPSGLEEQIKNKKYLWGLDNWELNDPLEMLEEKRVASVDAQNEYLDFYDVLVKDKYIP